MAEKAKITVIIVNYKGLDQDFLQKSLSSALAQTFSDYKIDIYLDSIEYSNTFIDSVNIFDIPPEIQNDPLKIREYSINNTDSEYIAFWDSDDIFNVNKLDVLYEISQKNNAEISFSNFGFFNNSGIREGNFFDIIGFKDREINILDENFVGLGVTLIKTEYLKSLLPFPKVSRLDWWIMMKSVYNKKVISSTSEILAYYRIHENSLSSMTQSVSIDNFRAEIDAKLKIYKSLKNEHPELLNRIEYYKNIDLESDYKEIENKFLSKKYKNIWGGLIDYEKE